MAFRYLLFLTICLFGTGNPLTVSADEQSDVRTAMKSAVDFFMSDVAVNGGYVYFYSPDLSRRRGEGVASPTEIWVQPPGTPTVGLALIEAWHATGDDLYLKGATDAAEALIYGQLKSGGWTSSVDFDPRGRTAAYRHGKGKGRNFSTLDDGTTQGALQLLMRVDQAHEFNHQQIHEATQIALDALLKAQFQNGAFPQGWDEVDVATNQPVLSGTYPDYDWKTEGRIKEYWDLYTLNDGAAGTITETLLAAHDIYGAKRYETALERLGDFLIVSQMPQPQPAWAQQYNFQMNPVWARRFEPAAIAGRESQDVIASLMKIYVATGNPKYLQPIARAIKYLETSTLDDGRLARYYELRSNRPLYMERNGDKYSLTYDDSRLPKHYGWKVENRLADLKAEFERLTKAGPVAKKPSPLRADRVQQIISSLDSTGRWINRYNGERLIGQAKFKIGDSYISSEEFSTNLTTLARWLTQQSQ